MKNRTRKSINLTLLLLECERSDSGTIEEWVLQAGDMPGAV